MKERWIEEMLKKYHILNQKIAVALMAAVMVTGTAPNVYADSKYSCDDEDEEDYLDEIELINDLIPVKNEQKDSADIETSEESYENDLDHVSLATSSDAKKEDVPVELEDLYVSPTEFVLPEAERDGYRFVAWNTKNDGSGESHSAGETIEIVDQTLYAIWEELPKTATASDATATVSDATPANAVKEEKSENKKSTATASDAERKETEDKMETPVTVPDETEKIVSDFSNEMAEEPSMETESETTKEDPEPFQEPEEEEQTNEQEEDAPWEYPEDSEDETDPEDDFSGKMTEEAESMETEAEDVEPEVALEKTADESE
jgi:uncharacterized repeat protein (TIGR02543 family)